MQKLQRVQRFPRLRLSQKAKLAEQVLHHTFNQLARTRFKPPFWDLYKTKQGRTARAKFFCLAQELVSRKIDPAIYLRVLCKYGKFENTPYLPPPSWLASEKALETFAWMLKRETRRFPQGQWRSASKGWSSKQALESVQNGIAQVRVVRKAFGLKSHEAILLLQKELSPWFLAALFRVCGKPKPAPATKQALRYLKFHPGLAARLEKKFTFL